MTGDRGVSLVSGMVLFVNRGASWGPGIAWRVLCSGVEWVWVGASAGLVSPAEPKFMGARSEAEPGPANREKIFNLLSSQG